MPWSKERSLRQDKLVWEEDTELDYRHVNVEHSCQGLEFIEYSSSITIYRIMEEYTSALVAVTRKVRRATANIMVVSEALARNQHGR
jgi:hypothetical protein